MLFTSIPAAPNTTPSLLFREQGNMTDIAAALSDVHLTGLMTKSNILFDIRRSNFQTVMMANAGDKKEYLAVGETPFRPIINFIAPDVFLPLPKVAVKEPTSTSNIQTILKQHNFIKEDSGRQPMMVGPGNPDLVKTLTDKGADLTINAPLGSVNISGWHTANIMNRLVFWATKSLQEPAFVTEEHPAVDQAILLASRTKHTSEKGSNPDKALTFLGVETTRAYAMPLKTEWKLYLDDPASLPQISGTVLPYYPTLLLFDPNYLFATFTRLFKYCLGNNLGEATAVLRIIKAGVNTLGRTSFGSEMSHALCAINLALDTGCGIVFLRDGNQYKGAVILGCNYQIFKGLNITVPTPRSQLIEDIKTRMGHSYSLKELAGLLSKTPLYDEDEETLEDVSVDEIASPRALYLAVIQRKLAPEFTKAVHTLAVRLSFTQEYLKVTADNVFEVMEAISTKSQLPSSYPFPYKTQHLFTRDTTLAALVAFGTTAPTFRAYTGVESKLLRVNISNEKETKEKMTRWMSTTSPPLDGIPVYSMEVEKAKASWDDLKKTGAIRVIFRGNRIAGNPARVFTKVDGYRIAAVLSDMFAISSKDAKKRKRDDKAEGGNSNETKEEGPEKKKKKTKANKLASFLLGEQAELSEPNDEGGSETSMEEADW
ncbi:hypothetical protein [Tulasnella ambivirus 4]|uniref:Uncharacterized protein n=1 Tax=Tulasnella ambivirus 4 TaxID=2772292 RepID=A0A7S7YF63_9VIRU|nr:hypothetical protein [Tulasnella ambivirus 4]